MPEPLLTPEEIAELVGCSYHGVLRDIRAGRLRATKIGKGYRVEVDWYRDWLEQNVVTPISRPRPQAPKPVRRGPVPAGSVEALDRIERQEKAA